MTANQLALRGISPTTTRSLGTQTILTLLQTQDINQTPPGGHGGGGHHSINLTPTLEAEAAAETEESLLLRRRKKLAKKLEAANASETDEVDENGEILPDDNVEQNNQNQSDKKAGS
jgi:hypothetical protein